MKIYTKRGDQGTTSLVGGTRVSKDDPRVESYGTVDELMAHTAYLRDVLQQNGTAAEYCVDLERILSALMTASALLALEEDASAAVKEKMPALEQAEIAFLEERIDAMTQALPEARFFTLPGGHPMVSLAHICRTVCRRAERSCVSAARQYTIDAQVMAYINRLSDYFYTLGRAMAKYFDAEEIFWKP